jgi:pyruvate carboxylase subunit B
MNTAFRDGFQSVFGARVFTKDFIPAVEAACDAGFTHFEAGGGARFQSLYLYCNECAFDMMDAFRAATGPHANLQTLARGVNVVGLDSQSSDVIKLHAELFKKHGISTIRNFDALNDVRNLTYSGQCIVDAGLAHEVVITMMELPPDCEGAHTPEFYIGVLKDILDSGVPYSSVCFKDASGTAVPAKVYKTIKLARKMLPPETHLRVHTHETAGISVMTYKAALDAGADGIDLAMAPCSGGTSQPDAVIMWHALRGTEFDLGLDVKKVLEAEEVFKECMKDYFIPPEAKAVEPLIPFSPMPGGALTANTQMMRDNQMLDRYPEVILAMSEVVRRGGFSTSVTPVSQFYFQQAFNNVIFGPWKRIAEGYGKMVLGYFGHTPMPPDPEIIKLSMDQLGLEPTEDNPREINDRDPTKGVKPAQDLLKAAGLDLNDENTFIAAALGPKGITYLKGEATIGVRKNVASVPAAEAPSDHYRVTVNGETFDVHLEGDRATVAGETYSFSVDTGEGGGGAAGSSVSSGPSVDVVSEMPGKVLRINCKVGDAVQAGQALLVLEALKMEIPVNSPQAGVVRAVYVSADQQVPAGSALVSIG